MGQEPVARQDINPMVESTTDILLNRHDIKLTANDLPFYPLQQCVYQYSPEKILIAIDDN